MATTLKHPVPPTFEDVFSSFGYQLTTVREPRITQENLALALNKMALEERAKAEFTIADQKEDLQEIIKEMDAKIVDLKSASEVTAPLIREWEAGRKLPTQSQFTNMMTVFELSAPLTDKEAEDLKSLYDIAVTNAKFTKKGPDTAVNFGEALRELIAKRQDRDEQPLPVHRELAKDICGMADKDPLDKLNRERASIQQKLETLPAITEKQYFLVDGNGKKQPLTDAAGNLKLRSEHLNLIEHNIIPSPDLYRLILKGIGGARRIEADEASELYEKYESLVSSSEDHFGMLRRHGHLNGDPLEAFTMNAPQEEPTELKPSEAQISLTPPPEKSEIVEDPEPKPSGQSGLASAQAALIAGANGVSSNGDQVRVDDPTHIDESQLDGSTNRVRYTPPTIAKGNSKEARLAEVYAAIFAEFGFTAPSNSRESTAKKDNSGGIRTQLGIVLGLNSNRSIEELRPFSLTELAKDTKTRLIGKAPNYQRMIDLTDSYNALVAEIRNDISTSDAGKNLTRQQQIVAERIRRDERSNHKFDDIMLLNSETGVDRKDFEDYFKNGGLQMLDAPEMKEILGIVHSRWHDQSGGRYDAFRHHNGGWLDGTQDYISAHQATRAQYNGKRNSFDTAMDEIALQAKQEDALREMAKEYVLLSKREEVYTQANDDDLRLSPEEARKLGAFKQRLLDGEPAFTAAVDKETDMQGKLQDYVASKKGKS